MTRRGALSTVGRRRAVPIRATRDSSPTGAPARRQSLRPKARKGAEVKLRYQVLAALTAALIAASAALATPSGRSMSNVWRFSDGSTVMGAGSSVVRTDQGASFTIRTSDLAAGDAVTVWWVVFNNPELCTAGEGDFRCGIGDLLPFGGDPRVDSSAFYAAGHVIGGSGMTGFEGHTTTRGPDGRGPVGTRPGQRAHCRHPPRRADARSRARGVPPRPDQVVRHGVRQRAARTRRRRPEYLRGRPVRRSRAVGCRATEATENEEHEEARA